MREMRSSGGETMLRMNCDRGKELHSSNYVAMKCSTCDIQQKKCPFVCKHLFSHAVPTPSMWQAPHRA